MEPARGAKLALGRTTMSAHDSRFRRRQYLTVALLITGYVGYYLCRSNLPVTMPLLIRELGPMGYSPDAAKIRLGEIASLGVLAYALGKFANGILTEFLGGRRSFLTGMAGSALFTVGFALTGTLPLFTLFWIGGRFSGSMGWAGIVKIASRWFSFRQYGTAMGVISLSFLFGDAAVRAFMGALIELGVGWRGVFFAAAGTLGAIFVASSLLLRESPSEVGFEEPETSPLSVFGERAGEARPPGLGELLRPLLTSPTFWLVCVLSLGLTLMRETFNIWTPTYFQEVLGLDDAEAAAGSSLFPFAGGVSVLLAGLVSDRLGAGGRGGIIVAGLGLGALTLLGMGFTDFANSPGWGVGAVGLVGFLLIGPYSYLAGAIALEVGGRQGGAATSGFVDGVGYLGGMLAGGSMARVSVAYGWGAAFLILAAVGALSTLAALAFLWAQRR